MYKYINVFLIAIGFILLVLIVREASAKDVVTLSECRGYVNFLIDYEEDLKMKNPVFNVWRPIAELNSNQLKSNMYIAMGGNAICKVLHNETAYIFKRYNIFGVNEKGEFVVLLKETQIKIDPSMEIDDYIARN